MKISTETLLRTVFLVISLGNQLLTAWGFNPLPFSDEEVYSGLSALATAISATWAWWKNNSFTSPALQADAYMAELKKGEKK